MPPPTPDRRLGRRQSRLRIAAWTLALTVATGSMAAPVQAATAPATATATAGIGGGQGVAEAAVDRPAAEPRFLLETVTVQGARAFSPDIVLGESRLVAGRAYSEDELRDAMSRIVRLPLILDAEVALSKGSERGRYELVITVVEARRWFFGVDGDLTLWSQPISIDGLNSERFTESTEAFIGRRWRAGPQGVFFAAVGGDDGTLQVGYNRYNFFGRGALLSVSWSLASCDQADPDLDDSQDCGSELFDLGLDPSFSTWSTTGDSHRLRLGLGMPLAGNRSLRFDGAYRRTDSGIRRDALRPERNVWRFADREDFELAATWIDDSVDDPVLPTRGRRLEVAADYRTLAARQTVGPRLAGSPRPENLNPAPDSQQLRLGASGDRYRPLNDRDTAWAGFGAAVGAARVEESAFADGRVVDDDLALWDLSAHAGLARDFVRQRQPWRELRWSGDLELFHRGTSPSLGVPENPRAGIRLGTGLLYRTSWGVIRVRLSFVFTGDSSGGT